MAQYKVIKTIPVGGGYIHTSQGMVPVSSLVPKVGEIVEGEIEEVYLWYKLQKGLSMDIKTDIGEGTRIFIPEENLQLITNVNQPISSTLLTRNNLTIAIIVISIGILYYKVVLKK